LIEATEQLVIDLDHLENCIKRDLAAGKFKKGKMILVLSYMRGRVPNMHKVVEICEKYSITLLEDSAHGYGCSFDGKMCGSYGVVSTVSTQANKLVNTGEGGLIFTNNADLQAFFIFSAGSYEELWRKHEDMAPPEEVALKYKYTVSCLSVRMTNIQGALMHPQLAVMNERIDQHNAMYYHLVKQTHALLDQKYGKGTASRVEFIPQAHELVGPVYDSLQIRIKQKDGTIAEEEFKSLDQFLKDMQAKKYTMAKFSDPANARNFISWQYLNLNEIKPEALPQTNKFLVNVCDLRLLCHDTEKEMDKLASDMVDCMKTLLCD
jgi:dTDP-4-amino-4,6-dideoxygalactose transaminase